MEVIEIVNTRTENPATKLGEDKLNYIVRTREDNGNIYCRVYFNSGFYARIETNEIFLSLLKEYTWIKEKENNCVKSNSDSLNTIYLNDFLDEYALPKYEIFEGKIEGILNIK